MKPNLPQIPNAQLIESMCMRFDHAHGIPTISSGTLKLETDEEFKRRQEYNRSIMRKLYEEVSGYGFYQYPTEDDSNE